MPEEMNVSQAMDILNGARRDNPDLEEAVSTMLRTYRMMDEDLSKWRSRCRLLLPLARKFHEMRVMFSCSRDVIQQEGRNILDAEDDFK